MPRMPMTLKWHKPMNPFNKFSVRAAVALVLALMLVGGCSKRDKTDGQQLNQTSDRKQVVTIGPLSYSLETQLEKLQDELSPAGFWQTEVSKPVFFSDNITHQTSADSINTYLNKTLQKIRCDSGGDHALLADVEDAMTDQIQLNIELMWMCPTMPSPEQALVTASFGYNGQLINENWEAGGY